MIANRVYDAPRENSMDPIEMKKRIEAAVARGDTGEMVSMMRDVRAKQFASDVTTARIGFGVGVVLTALFGGVLAYVGVEALLQSNDGPGVGLLLGGVVLLAISGGLGAMAVSISPPPTELAHSGVPAKATIEDYRSAFGSFSVGGEGNSRSVSRIAIDLAVSPSVGAPYRVTIKQHLSTADIAALKVGSTVDAFVDRTRPDRILLVLA